MNSILAIGYAEISKLSQSTDTETYLKAWCDYLWDNYTNLSKYLILGVVVPNSHGLVVANFYTTKRTYASAIYVGINKMYMFGYNNSVWYYNQVTTQ